MVEVTMNVFSYAINMNIKRFQNLLDTSFDESERQTIQKKAKAAVQALEPKKDYAAELRLAHGRYGCWEPPTESPETVTRLRLPQKVACGFSTAGLQHRESLQLPVREEQLWSQ
jgi:hypothetical protein